MSIVLQSSGGGSITINEPTTASNYTQTLPASTGTVLTTGSPASGNVIQVVQGTTSSTTNTTSTTPVSTSLTASITPLFSTSKILIISTFSLYVTSASKSIASIYRNSTNLSASQGTAYLYNAIGGSQSTSSINLLDSPATTSATSYTIYLSSSTGGAVALNADSQNAYIILLEVAA
jgi:hypothetical protein